MSNYAEASSLHWLKPKSRVGRSSQYSSTAMSTKKQSQQKMSTKKQSWEIFTQFHSNVNPTGLVFWFFAWFSSRINFKRGIFCKTNQFVVTSSYPLYSAFLYFCVNRDKIDFATKHRKLSYLLTNGQIQVLTNMRYG